MEAVPSESVQLVSVPQRASLARERVRYSKFNIDGVEGVYVISDDVTDSGGQKSGQKGGQKGGQKNADKTIDTILQFIKDNPSITRKSLAKIVGISQSAIQKTY